MQSALFETGALENLGTAHCLLGIVAATIGIALYALYQYLLPKPIAGIPYNPSALKSIFGDIPAMVKNCNGSPMRWMVSQGLRWMVSQGQRRNSPIFQVFVMPFAKPSVVVSDFRKAQDILMRRKEFDRSDFTIALLSSEILGVAVPNIYESAPWLVDLWRAKALDIGDLGFVQLAWWWKRLQPRERRLMDMRAEFVKDQVACAVEKLQRDADEDSESWVKSAIDLIIHRERKFAKKEGREPACWSPIMKDELLGFIMADHDTTTTTLCWGVKLLVDSERAQTRLREALRAAYAAALAEGRAPLHGKIAGTRSLYLDAVVEEVLRLAYTAPVVDWQCTRDTEILGYCVPAGTVLLLPNLGPSFTLPEFKIDEALRSETSRARRLVLVFDKTSPTALNDKVIAIARYEREPVAFISTICLPIAGLDKPLLHTGLTVIHPAHRKSGITLDMFADPSGRPSEHHLAIARDISANHRDKMLISPSVVFDEAAFVFRGSNDSLHEQAFRKDVDDQWYWHRDHEASVFIRKLFRQDKGDEVL
ncbi:cytochrome P450 [Colletotrichum cereale]|nr:cytochrome P450 [Colletotrichum cereale]